VQFVVAVVVAGRVKAKKKFKLFGYGTGSHGRSLSRSYRFIHIVIAAACPWPIVLTVYLPRVLHVHKTWFCIHGAFSQR
jgi:hypothetical protein